MEQSVSYTASSATELKMEMRGLAYAGLCEFSLKAPRRCTVPGLAAAAGKIREIRIETKIQSPQMGVVA